MLMAPKQRNPHLQLRIIQAFIRWRAGYLYFTQVTLGKFLHLKPYLYTQDRPVWKKVYFNLLKAQPLNSGHTWKLICWFKNLAIKQKILRKLEFKNFRKKTNNSGSEPWAHPHKNGHVNWSFLFPLYFWIVSIFQ